MKKEQYLANILSLRDIWNILQDGEYTPEIINEELEILYKLTECTNEFLEQFSKDYLPHIKQAIITDVDDLLEYCDELLNVLINTRGMLQ